MWLFLLGVLLTPAMYYGARWVAGYFQPSTLADALQWEVMADRDLIGLKDGAFLAVWEVYGPDLSFTTPERADSLAGKVKRLLDTLDGKTMVHVDTIRVPSGEHKSPDGEAPPVAIMIDEERKSQNSSGDQFENRTFIALTISADSSEASWYSDLLYTGDYNARASYKDKVDAAQTQAREFEQNIPDALNSRRLSGSDLTSYLYQMMTGRDQEVTPPPPEYPSLRYLFAHDLQSGFEPRVGNRWYSVVGIWGYPDEISLGVSEALREADFGYRYSNRLLGIDQSDALSAIKKRTKNFQVSANDWLSLLSDDPEASDPQDLYKDDHAQTLAHETKDVERIVKGGTSLLHHTGLILVWDEDKKRCQEKAVEVKKYLRNVGGGFIIDQEKGLATEALVGSWAGHGKPNPRRYLMLSPAASRLLPITSTYPGPTSTPCSYYENDDGTQPPPLFYARTEENVPFRYSPFGESGDVGHQAVIGPTGSGKSILLAFQALRQLLFDGGRTIVFDRGYSFAPLVEALGGNHYDLDAANVGFQPLANIHKETELRWAIQWISTIAELQGLEVGPGRRERIRKTLRTLAEDPDRRTLQNLKMNLLGRDTDLAQTLKPFAGKGALGGLLNSSQDNFQDDRIIAIELGSLTDLSPSIFTPVLTYLFHKIETLLSPQKPTHVIADEFFALARKSDVGRQRIEEALRTYRKLNAFVTIGTQAPGDLIGEDTQGILGSIQTKIMLPNPDALSEVQMQMYRRIGLNEEEIKLVARSRPKREYISIQPHGSRKFDLGLDLELAFLEPYQDLSLKQTAQRIREYKSKYGRTWIQQWLRLRGMDEYASRAPYDENTVSSQRLLPASEETPAPNPKEPQADRAAADVDNSSSSPSESADGSDTAPAPSTTAVGDSPEARSDGSESPASSVK